MIVYEIPGPPVSWQRAGRSGKRTFDTQKGKKDVQRWHIKSLANGLFPAFRAIKLVVEYHMPIPKSYSKRRAKECLLGPHSKKPDLSNLIKFTEDAFIGLLWSDDAIITEIEAKKFYSDNPKTVFKIECMADKYFKEMK